MRLLNGLLWQEEGASSDEEPGSSASESGGRTRQQAPPQQQFHLLPAEDSVLAAGGARTAQHVQQAQQQAQQPQRAQQALEPLHFDTKLPSFPSDAAFALGGSGAAEPGPLPGCLAAGTPRSALASQTGGRSGGGVRWADAAAAAAARQRGGTATGGAGAEAPPAAAAAAGAAGVGAQPLAPALPRLRLGRVSTPLGGTRDASGSLPASPRPGRAAALSADAASAPTSPRGVMHGLVRTSLLPAAADRQAVQQVSELMDGEGDGGGGGSAAAGAAGSGPSAAFSSWSTQPPSPAMTPRTAAQITPRTAAQLAASGLSAAAVAPSEPSSPAFTPRTAGLLASLGGGPRPLRHTASGSTSSSGGGSRLGGGAGRPATARCVGGGFGGGLAAGSRPAHAGLAVLFKPPSPGKISPLPSAGASPEPSELPAVAEGPSEPPDEPTAAEALGFGRGLQEEAAAAAAQCVDAAAAAAVPGSQRARQQAQRAPAAAALEQAVPLAPLDSFPSPSGRLGELVSAEEAAELGPFTAAGTAGVAHEAGATEEAGPAAAAQPQGAVSSPGRSRSLALPPLVHELLSPLDLPPTVEAEEGSTHGSAAAPATALPPAAMAAALTGAGIKPWQAGALLLRRSMSSPLTGIAGQLEAAEHQAAAGQGAGKGCAGGGAAGAGQAAPGMPGVGVGGPGGGQMSDEVLAEVRLRLVAGGYGD